MSIIPELFYATSRHEMCHMVAQLTDDYSLAVPIILGRGRIASLTPTYL